jgi:hypothetical protein
MHIKPELKSTRDYSIFEFHEFNRPLHDDPVLYASMKRHGWMPSSPAQVVSNGNGRLKVVRGHHRLDIAKRLKLAVWYVVDETNTDPWALEGGRSKWTGADFAVARASAGDKDVQAVLDFKRKHGIELGLAASLLGGEAAGSGNKLQMIKTGTFKVAADLSHAKKVAALVDRLRDLRVEFATQSAFVSALSMLVYLAEFEPAVFCHKVAQNKDRLERRSTADRYLEEIENLYNFAAKKALPLAFMAREASKKRRAIKFPGLEKNNAPAATGAR